MKGMMVPVLECLLRCSGKRGKVKWAITGEKSHD